jgi:predicted dehydrogenase
VVPAVLPVSTQSAGADLKSEDQNLKDIVMLGCGGFSRRYHVPTLTADPRVRLVGIYDPYANDEVRDLARRTGAVVVDRLDLLPAADAALVTTPHTLHASHVEHALERGWAVLVDKPFVMKTQDARRLADKASRAGLLNAVAFNRRLDPGCLRARALIASGAIGQTRLVHTVQLGYERAGWFLRPELGGGGAFTGRGTHMADIVPWLLGSRPHSVRSRIRPSGTDRCDHGGFIDLEFTDIECQMTCIDQGLHMWDEIRVFGGNGLIELRRPAALATGWAMNMIGADGRSVEMQPAEPATGWITREFIDALHGAGGVSCTFADAALSVEIIEAAFESANRTARASPDPCVKISAP